MEFRSFGRRRGRKLRSRQSMLYADLLPRIAIKLPQKEQKISLKNIFYDAQRPLNLEIGFGGGEYLCWRAQEFPTENFMGVEPFENGVAKCLSTMVDAWGMENVFQRNVRLFPDDVRDLLLYLPDNCLDRVDILFPDPWPKSRHSRRRLINAGFLRDLTRVMKPNVSLYIATDHQGYLSHILGVLENFEQLSWHVTCANDWRLPFYGFLTRYAEKAQAAGRKGYYLHYTLNA